MKKLLLIDGHSILNRAFYGIRDLTNSEGLHTNAVYGFLNTLFKILDEEQPDYLTVAFDRSEPTFRHQMYAAYKGNRKPMQEELREQVPVIKDVLHAMGIVTVEQPGYEADDILGTISRRAEAAGLAVRILSGDRDLLQLATDRVEVRIPKTKQGGTVIEDYYAADVTARYQVTPTEFIDVKALMGDSSDNIPGVPGIGEKGATAIIVQYQSIENAYAHVDEITPPKAQKALAEHYDMAQLSKELATIDTEAPIAYEMEAAALGDIYTPAAYEWMRRLEFRQFLPRFSDMGTSQNTVEEHFSVLTEETGQEAFLAKAEEGRAAVVFLEEGGILYGVAVAVAADTIAYFPCETPLMAPILEQRIQRFCDALDTVIAPDLKALMKHVSVPEGRGWDMELAAYLLHPLKSAYVYDDIAQEYIGQNMPSRAELLGSDSITRAVEEKKGKKNETAAERAERETTQQRHRENVPKLACFMAYTAFCAQRPLMDALADAGMERLYTEVELPLVYVLDAMEKEGVCVDGDALREYGEELGERIAALERRIYEQAGEEFNINSPKQLGVILFEKLQMPNGKKTKTGYSTAADVLERLAPDYPIVSDILEYRQLAKLKSTYAEGLGACIGPDGRIHTTFRQTVTATGRLSSTEPNLQNIPIRMEMGRLFRKVFIPREGCVFLDADYSQIELRVLAHMSEDENLIAAYRHAEDIHRITASQVFGVAPEEVTPLMRRRAKAVNFGIVYGISSFGLSQDLDISRKEAEAYIENYFATFPGIKAYLDGAVAEAKQTGFAVTLFGRRRPIPELHSGNFMERQFGERIAMNSPIQGTAADIMKIAMNRVYRRLNEAGLRSRVVLQVHDELLVEAAEDEVEAVRTILREEMCHAAELSVDLEVDIGEGPNWLEAH